MAFCGGDGAAIATKWGKWNMDMGSAGRRFREPLNPRPRPPQAAWAQLRTGPPDAEGGRGRSSGQGCEDRASSSLAARQSAPSSGDWSMVSAPTRSPLCGLPRLIGPPLSQESVHNRNAE